MSRSAKLRACFALIMLLSAKQARAEYYYAGELSLSSGAYRLSGSQDLGDYGQLVNLRRQVLATTFASLEARSAYCFGKRLCLGALLGVQSGAIDHKAALLLTYRLEGTLHLLVGRLRPFIGLSAGALSLFSPATVLGTDSDPVVAWSAGLKARLNKSWRLRIDFSHGLTDSQQAGALAHNFSVTVGGSFAFARRSVARPVTQPLDSDGDGIVNAQDKCPQRVEDPDGFADHDGCPDEDNDGDGIVDYRDICPNRRGPGPRGCPTKEQTPKSRSNR